MLWLKQCPKCTGDLDGERDMYGEFVACMQCGYYLSDSEMGSLISRGKLGMAKPEEVEKTPALVA